MSRTMPSAPVCRSDEATPPAPTWRASHLGRLASQLLRQPTSLAAILGSSLALNVLGLVAPRMTQAVLDGVSAGAGGRRVAEFLAVIVIASGVQAGLALWRRLRLVRLSLDADRVLLATYCAHLLSLPSAFFRSRPAGDLVARFGDHAHVRHLLAGGLTRAAIDATMVVAYVVVMLSYSAVLAVPALAALALFGAYSLAAAPALRRHHGRLLAGRAAHEARLFEAVSQADALKAAAAEAHVRTRWEEAFTAYLDANYRTQRARQVLESAGATVQSVTSVLVLGLGALLVARGALTTGQLVAFSMYATQATMPLLGLIGLWDEVQQARVALNRLDEVWTQKPEASVAADPLRLPARLRGQVCFEDVWFGYGGVAPVLRGVSFEIRPGERVALVGRSGSGKTTIARLLLGLYRPTRGRVLVDGLDVAELDPAWYRRQVGAALQEGLLLAGTVAENIALGDPTPDRKKVDRAARLAGANVFVETLADGYDTPLGEWGATLSGGQRQRLALARALYRDPQIVVLDEPTSALDRQTEARVWRSLARGLTGRTVLMIVHDHELARRADRTLRLEDGQVTGDRSERAGAAYQRPGIGLLPRS